MSTILLVLGFLIGAGCQSTDISNSCAYQGVKLPVPSIFSSGYSVVSQADMDSSFRSYLYDRSTSNLANFILSLKPYLIPILVLVGLQILMLVFVGARKLYRRRHPPKQPDTYPQVAIVFALLGACLAAAGVIALAALTIIASNTASKVVRAADCQTNLSVSQFLNGESDKWIGINNVAGQIDKASLSFNNNIRQLKSGLVGLTVNGSKLGMPLNATFPTIESLVTGALVIDYLYRNTSANTNRFPICQNTPILLPNPNGSAVQVRLGYQKTMCESLTNESNMLIVQARSLDTMNAQLTNLVTTASRNNITGNLSALSSSYSSFANTTQVKTFDFNPSSSLTETLAYTMSGLSIGLALFVIAVLIIRNEKLARAYPLIYVLTFLLTAFSAVVSIWYMASSAAVYSGCQLYSQALTDKSVYSQVASKFNVGGSVDPIYFCAANPTSTFMNSTQTAASLASIANLTLLQTNFNNSIPADVLTSKSIGFINQLSSYLADLSTLSINSSQSIPELLVALGQVGDFTYNASTQAPLCNVSRDEFVFDPSRCTRTLLDPTNTSEVTTTQPRCIQIPINNRTSGTVNTSLNMMQHLYVINTSCTSIPNIFNAANNCFLKLRATPLFSTACPTVFTEYTTRLKNLVAFSYLAGEYTDAYLQNMRNYLGTYLTVSSNMTAFYLSTNVTTIVGEIASNVTNISKLGNCSYPSQKVTEVRNAYCENVLPSMFQAFVICLGGLCCMVLLTVLVHIAEYPLDHVISSSKISTELHTKVRIDSSMNLEAEGEGPRLGFDLNLTDNEPPAQEPAYQNILMDSSHYPNDYRMQPEFIENHKSASHSQRSAQLVEVKCSHPNEEDNKSADRSSAKMNGSQTPIRKLEKESGSNSGSAKQARSEFVDRNEQVLFQFDQDPSGSSKDKIKPPDDVEENIELDEKFETSPNNPAEGRYNDTQEDEQLGIRRIKPTVETEESEVKRIVYARSTKNIILGTNAKNYLRRLHKQKQQRSSENLSAMEVNDFGFINSQERKKSDDEDPTTTKKMRGEDEHDGELPPDSN